MLDLERMPISAELKKIDSLRACITMSDDEELTLSADTLLALQQFAAEQDERTKKFEELSHQAEADFDSRKNMNLFQEDWQLSQFWYTEETADTFAREMLEESEDKPVKIAVISAPSTYSAMLRVGATPKQMKNVYLLEFDQRFSSLAGENFIFYDYKSPVKLSAELKGTFDKIMIDPPFLEPDCQTKAAMTARWLLKPEGKVVLATGERMHDLVPKLYKGIKMTTFFPEHANGLSNEFRCYANYEGNNWRFAAN